MAAMKGICCACPDSEVSVLNVSDGGEGMLDAFLEALHGKKIIIGSHDAMMRPIMAEYGIAGHTAIIETAKSVGLTLIEPTLRNAVAATSWGVGEIIADALSKGCTHFIIGLGGSATTDAGIGMLQAIINKLAPQGGSFDSIRQQLHSCKFTVASDVDNPLLGENGAARVFAPQKGASLDQVLLLEKRLQLFSSISSRHFGYDRSSDAGAGAAGGLGYAFLQFMNAEFCSGADLLLDLLDFDRLADEASLVITGEGSADRQTLMGKLPVKVLHKAHKHNVPVLLLSGILSDKDALSVAGFDYVACINPPNLPKGEAMKLETAYNNLAMTVANIVREEFPKTKTR